ncbi:TSUP family transporter [Rothia sp. AR01]|uniref:Probable membrane transporter protein n=1 Tax=Rothia santali TaxID=2949643 RepID=A0A9X2HCA2_9MICC|nr:TSUP family transporter [Rothia santali]MCP3425067.1 TSUP family transporter [Rothia santali]
MTAVLESLDPGILTLIVVAGFAAGWVDAVVGGGGLIQLPVVLLIPGMSPVQALATNKMGSVFGTATSAVTFYRRTTAPLRPALPMAAVAFCGSFGGASVASLLPAEVFKPVILAALIGVASFTVARPQAGQLERPQRARREQALIGTALGVGIGFYDGILGPGTGSFLIIGMITLLGFSFLRASAQAKVVNLATNLGALLFFSLNGSLVPLLGLVLGAANMLGGYVGARSAVARGNRFIRVVFLAVVLVLIAKMAWDVYRELLA